MSAEKDQLIFDAFATGTAKGLLEQTKPEYFESQISHVFLYPTTVYKIYKRNNEYFNRNFRDLSDEAMRRDFYQNDFFWNNYFSPHVYQKLQGISVTGGIVRVTDEIQDVDDLVIQMNRVNLKSSLSLLLHGDSIPKTDFRRMGFEMTKSIAAFPHTPKSTENYYSIEQRERDDARDWMYSADRDIPRKETDAYIAALRNYIERHKEKFMQYATNKYSIALDNHSDNIFYENGKMFFIDIYPPKDAWILNRPELNTYRPATDIFILRGEEYARAFIQGYKDYYGSMDESDEWYYFLYSAGIQCTSLFNITRNGTNRMEDAKKYWEFIQSNLSRLA